MISCGMRAPSMRMPFELRTASAKRVAQTSSQINRAAEEIRLKRCGDVLDVLWANEAADVGVQPTEPGHPVQLVDLKEDNRPIGILADEDEVEDPHGTGFDQIHQFWGNLTVELVPWESNDDVLDWSYRHVIRPWLSCASRLRPEVAASLTLKG